MSQKTIKKGSQRGLQRYQCRTCNYVFLSKRRQHLSDEKILMEDYIFHKQTHKEISDTHGTDRRDVQHILGTLSVASKIHNPRPVHILVDATYFGERKEDKSWCVLVARDPIMKENIASLLAHTETTYGYVLLREELERYGYTVLSVTGDGFGGIRSAFHGIPFQMCHVHMERLVIKYTTRKPLTEAGRVLLALTRTLHHTDSHIFTERLKQFGERYKTFLDEKTIHPVTGDWSYTHEGVRTAYFSLVRLRKYLFTYERDENISTTTNSLEGHFRHVKKHLGAHSGLTLRNQQKILAVILQASSVSPSRETLDELWK